MSEQVKPAAVLYKKRSEKGAKHLVRRLMAEADLVSRQPGAHRYKVAESERVDIPNHLDREFDCKGAESSLDR